VIEAYLKDDTPTGGWLIKLSTWDKKWFARMVVDRSNVEARLEIVDLVAAAGYKIELPKSHGFLWERPRGLNHNLNSSNP
jgi:hypothetical protein